MPVCIFVLCVLYMWFCVLSCCVWWGRKRAERDQHPYTHLRFLPKFEKTWTKGTGFVFGFSLSSIGFIDVLICDLSFDGREWVCDGPGIFTDGLVCISGPVGWSASDEGNERYTNKSVQGWMVTTLIPNYLLTQFHFIIKQIMWLSLSLYPLSFRCHAVTVHYISLYSLCCHAYLSYFNVPCFLKEWWPSEITLNVSYREWMVHKRYSREWYAEDIAVALLERHIGYILLNLWVVRCFGYVFIFLKQCCCGRSAESEWHGEWASDPCLIVGTEAFASRKVGSSMLLFLLGICI